MEWREQFYASCNAAFLEAQRWVEAVTKKTFGSNNFRSALENGVLLCDLINSIKPGIIKRVNRLSTPIAGLDNLNVFLKACKKIGLKEAQLFHPGDLQDTSTRVTVKDQETSRRLKNVLITLYWLGRNAQSDPFYDGPNLKLNHFKGLLGIAALAKALEESHSRRASSSSLRERDRGFGESWCSEKEEKEDIFPVLGGGVHRREDSLDSFDSLGSRPRSRSSDNTLKGCGSDSEAGSDFRMAGDSNKDFLHYRRSLVIAPKTTTQFNQFLPTKDKPAAYVPAPLRKKRAERHEDNRRSWASPLFTEEDGTFTRSKSMTDLEVDLSALRQVQYEELQKIRDQVKETEDQWQDDLTKWKNRRKSVNSDIVKKKEEREQVEQINTSSGLQRSSRSSIGSRLNSLASLDLDVFEDSAPVVRPRTLPARSYTIDIPNPSARHPSPTHPTFSPTMEEDPVPVDTTSIIRDISTSRDDMSDSATDSDSDTASIGQTSNYNPHTPVPLEKDPGFDISAAKMEETSSATCSINQTSTYNPQVTNLSPYEKAPSPPPRQISAALTEKPSIVGAAIGRTSNYTPHVLAQTPSEKVPTLTANAEKMSSTGTAATPSLLNKMTDARPPWEGKVADNVTPSIGAGSLYEQPPEHNYMAMETKNMPPNVSRVSSSLPRGYVRSDSSRLTSVVTARPFGSQSSRIASLPRAYTMDDSYKRVNGEKEVTKKPMAPSRYSHVMTCENEAHSSSPHSSGGEEEEVEVEEEAEKERESDVTPTLATSPVPPPARSPSPVLQPPKLANPVSLVPVKDTNHESYADMRISLNQKPNSSLDFGFQTEWDSTLVRVISIQPGSSAEMCQLQVGDEVLSVCGRRVVEMSFSQWKSSQELALKKGSLTMDIRRRGRQSSPDTTTSLDFTSRGSMGPSKEVANQPIIDVASNGLNVGFCEETVTLRNKESVEPISLKNLKRRSEFFEQGFSVPSVSALIYLCGGSESTISDMPVPPITPISNRWLWDAEAERHRQEKWQKEQEMVLQEKYRRDQEKLEEEWRRAQREAVTDGVSANHKPTPTREEQEEILKRKEEEAQRRKEETMRVEQERLREEERELLHLQEEKSQKQHEEERRRQREGELGGQMRKEEEREDRRHQEAEQQPGKQERKQEQEQWEKSKSTPDLDDVEKPDTTVGSSGVLGETSLRKGQQTLSQAELERQQILQEMKKKTQLSTDNSWIRQRSTSTDTRKDPTTSPIRRGESLDNLDTMPRSSWHSSWTPGSTSSIPNYSRPHSTVSGLNPTSFYGGGGFSENGIGSRSGSATLPSSLSMSSLKRAGRDNPSFWSQHSPSSPSPIASPGLESESRLSSQQRNRSVSGKKICTFCDTALGKGAAMIIESLGICYHLTCFKCIDCKSDLGGSEAGAEVRIRNRQLYCNSCYMRFKNGQPTSM